MTQVERLAAFAAGTRYEDLSDSARVQLKIRVLDALGCALGALGTPLIGLLQAQASEFGGTEKCTLIGAEKNAPDRAAFYNSALVRYLDFNDSYLAKGETCHPSDNLGAVVAACEYAGRSGRDLLTALALAYQVQCRLSDAAPVRSKGFDHVTLGSYAVAAGVARALGMDPEHTAHAIAISGTAFNALRVTRTGALSNWKGLAYANTAFGAVNAVFLARRGVTGPLEVFEGNKGFMESIAGPFTIDWEREDLERVIQTITKKHNAEIHSQSAIEAALELKRGYRLEGAEIERVEIEIFDVAFHIIGGGQEGDKRNVRTKEEADHSLPYLIAVALLDGAVMPSQFMPARIHGADVQGLLRKIFVRPREDFSARFPRELPCRLSVRLNDGRTLTAVKRDYEGFLTNPARWETVVQKFQNLSRPHTTGSLREQIADAVAHLEEIETGRLTELLRQVTPAPRDREEGALLYGP
ncbi:MAG TPA: MmgE/PrpD family protein [Bryobacteraceae bacterium]|nr:MmgE/PrpD family protein [Bryobacteraceae bacterium]